MGQILIEDYLKKQEERYQRRLERAAKKIPKQKRKRPLRVGLKSLAAVGTDKRRLYDFIRYTARRNEGVVNLKTMIDELTGRNVRKYLNDFKHEYNMKIKKVAGVHEYVIEFATPFMERDPLDHPGEPI